MLTRRQIKKKQFPKKKEKIQFHNNSRKIDYTLLKISDLFLLCIRSNIGNCNSANVASTRISCSVKHDHDYGIDPHSDRNSDEMGDCHSISSRKKHCYFYNMDGVIRKYRNLIIRTSRISC